MNLRTDPVSAAAPVQDLSEQRPALIAALKQLPLSPERATDAKLEAAAFALWLVAAMGEDLESLSARDKGTKERWPISRGWASG
jgi:hypothetical protein